MLCYWQNRLRLLQAERKVLGNDRAAQSLMSCYRSACSLRQIVRYTLLLVTRHGDAIEPSPSHKCRMSMIYSRHPACSPILLTVCASSVQRRGSKSRCTFLSHEAKMRQSNAVSHRSAFTSTTVHFPPDDYCTALDNRRTEISGIVKHGDLIQCFPRQCSLTGSHQI
jgi:hypothetical protein